MGQAFKERSKTLKVEGWDAIQIVINRKEDPPWWWSKKFGEGNREIERESDHCKTKKCIPKK